MLLKLCCSRETHVTWCAVSLILTQIHSECKRWAQWWRQGGERWDEPLAGWMGCSMCWAAVRSAATTTTRTGGAPFSYHNDSDGLTMMKKTMMRTMTCADGVEVVVLVLDCHLIVLTHQVLTDWAMLGGLLRPLSTLPDLSSADSFLPCPSSPHRWLPWRSHVVWLAASNWMAGTSWFQ